MRIQRAGAAGARFRAVAERKDAGVLPSRRIDLGSYLSGTPPVEKDDAPHARIAGEYSIEAHYSDWID